MISLAFAGLCFAGSPAHAQSSILQKGDGVITGFSGVAIPSTPFPAGVNPLDKILIDPEGSSAQILRLVPQGPLQGQVLTPSVFKIKAKDVGQVFGVALDDAPVKNIYLGATSAYGLQIVTPDTDGDGKPERAKLGSPDAGWMPAQFGNGGGPGSIYKIDGMTGAVSLFATIPNNSGPGIGQIVFDKTSHQFFASDLDTGLIHRIDASGALRDTFDHGVAGRTAAGLPPAADDGVTIDTKAATFNSEDPATWGYTPKARRVWGLAVNDGRLYYAVSEGPVVWSVAINPDGSFGNDPQPEIDASTLSSPNAISSIAFDDSGLIYLAQRGNQHGSYDYSSFAEANTSVVARYRRDPADPAAWAAMPEFYAIGSTPDYRSASGGIDIGLGFAANGAPSGQCNMLWSTGDALKQLGANPDSGVIQGLQGNDISAVRPADAPPTQTNFVDYDQMFADPTAAGHIGSIALWRNCDSAPAVTAQGGSIPPGIDPGPGGGVSPMPYPPGPTPYPPGPRPNEPTPHLVFSKTADNCMISGAADSYICYYLITIKNDGNGVFNDHIVVKDTPLIAGATVKEISGLCLGVPAGPTFTCDIVKTLIPGASIQMKAEVKVTIPSSPNMSCDVPNLATMTKPTMLSASAIDHLPPTVKCNSNPTPTPSSHIVIDKEVDGPCTGTGTGPYTCNYTIKVINNGPDNFGIKTVKITDTTSAAGGVVTVGAPFTCPGMPASSITCTSLMNIPAGKFLEAKSTVTIKSVSPGSSCVISNEADLVDPTPGMTSKATATLPATSGCLPTKCPPGTFGKPPLCIKLVALPLEISKTFQSCKLTGAFVTCDFIVKVTNPGIVPEPASFTDKLDIFDPSVIITQPGVPWSCKNAAAGGGAFTCTLSHDLAPGSASATVQVAVPVAILKTKYNCVIRNTAVIDGTTAGAAATALANVPGSGCSDLPPGTGNNNLRLLKIGHECVPGNGGYVCSYDIKIINTGPNAYPGGFAHVDDTVNGAFAIPTVSTNIGGSMVTCAGGVTSVGCTINPLPPLKVGDSFTFPITATLTFGDIASGICSIVNTATLVAPIGGSPENTLGNSDDRSTAEASITPLLPSCMQTIMKGQFTLGPSCVPGFNFDLDVRKCLPKKPSTPSCSPGFHVDPELRCVPISRQTPVPTCPIGTTGTPPDCQRLIPCPAGTTGTFEPDCRPVQPPGPQPQAKCPIGTTGTPPNCQRLIPCPAGTTGEFEPDCRPVQPPTPQPQAKCPIGTTGTPPDCKRLIPCPAGTTGTFEPDCRPVQPPTPQPQAKCPIGTTGTPPNCKRLIPCPRGTTGEFEPDCKPVAVPQQKEPPSRGRELPRP